MGKIRILIMDDREIARQGVAAVFKAFDPFYFIDAVSIQNGIREAEKHQPDAILVGVPEDLKATEEIVRLIKEACPFSLIIAIGDEPEPQFLYQLMDVGFDGYLLNHLLPGDMTKAVQVICHCRMICFPRTCLRASKVNDETNNTPTDGSDAVSTLTGREREIFRLIVQNYSNKRIASCLYISEPTVKSHIRSILHKLGAKNRMEAVLLGLRDNKAVHNHALLTIG